MSRPGPRGDRRGATLALVIAAGAALALFRCAYADEPSDRSRGEPPARRVADDEPERGGARAPGAIDAGRPERAPPLERRAPSGDPDVPTELADPETFDPGPGAEHVARYQGRSGRLSPHASVHGALGNVPTRSHMAPPNVLAWVDTRIAVAGEPRTFHAIVVGRGEDEVVPDTITLTIFREVPEDGTELAMRRDEREWQATYTPTTAAHPPPTDGTPPRVQYLVRATGRFEDEPYSRSATGWLLLHTPGGRIDASRPEVDREGTDLVVRVPVRIDRAGTYFGYAELWGGEGGLRPIAFARERVAWPPGDHVFAFLFGGAVIRESGVDGPYTVRNLRFMQVDTLPPHEQRPVEVVTTTPAWPASSFE